MQKMSVPLSIHRQYPKLENRIRQHYLGVLPGVEGREIEAHFSYIAGVTTGMRYY